MNGAPAGEHHVVCIPSRCPAGSSSAFEQPRLRLQSAFHKTHHGLYITAALESRFARSIPTDAVLQSRAVMWTSRKLPGTLQTQGNRMVV